MLELTPSAAATLAVARSRVGVPDHFGVRIALSDRPEVPPAYQLAFTEAPEEGDVVGEAEGTLLFVAAEAAGRLANLVLDATETEGEPKLVFRLRG